LHHGEKSLAFGVTNAADADGDGDSDGADFLAWQRQLGESPGLSPIPEPAAFAVAALSVLGLSLIRARKRMYGIVRRVKVRRSLP